MDGGWGMKSEFFDESIKAEKCVNDISQREHDTVCSDCSLASHQLQQASNSSIDPSHPIIQLHKAYGFEKKLTGDFDETTFTDTLLDIIEYEKVRREYRREIINYKKDRRLKIGPNITDRI